MISSAFLGVLCGYASAWAKAHPTFRASRNLCEAGMHTSSATRGGRRVDRKPLRPEAAEHRVALLSGSVRSAPLWRSLELPALAVVAVEVFVGFGGVGDFHVFAVELHLSAGAEGDRAEIDRIGNGRGVEEVAG